MDLKWGERIEEKKERLNKKEKKDGFQIHTNKKREGDGFKMKKKECEKETKESQGKIKERWY